MDLETMNRIKEYVDNQEEVRERFLKIYTGTPHISIARIAGEIDMSPTTLNNFIIGYRKMELRSLWAVDHWTQKKEEEFRKGIPRPAKRRRSHAKRMERI
jgi:hypothetical protein